jgi:hypothetical protein
MAASAGAECSASGRNRVAMRSGPISSAQPKPIALSTLDKKIPAA